MSGSFESVRWNACVHRLDLGLYCHPKSFGGMEFEPMLTPRKKIPSTRKLFKFRSSLVFVHILFTC